MEKMNDMPRNQVADDELDQVSGGKNFFDVFTTEFFEFFKDSKDQDTSPETAEGNDFGVSTLEMRIDPKKKREVRERQKIIKL